MRDIYAFLLLKPALLSPILDILISFAAGGEIEYLDASPLICTLIGTAPTNQH